MIQPTDVQARAARISMRVADGYFPISVIPAKGLPGSVKARVSLRLRTPDGIELVAEVAAKNLQRAPGTSQSAPGEFWVAQWRLASGACSRRRALCISRPQPRLLWQFPSRAARLDFRHAPEDGKSHHSDITIPCASDPSYPHLPLGVY